MVNQLAFLVHREPTGKLVTRYAFEAAGAAWGAGIRLEGLEFLALAGRHVRLQERIRCWGEPALESLVDSSAHFSHELHGLERRVWGYYEFVFLTLLSASFLITVLHQGTGHPSPGILNSWEGYFSCADCC